MTVLERIEQTYKQGVDLIRIKNADYAGENDFFKNFKSAIIAGVSVERAILVRILDKISRVSNLLDKPNEVKDETIEDTLIDIINYTAILKEYLYELRSISTSRSNERSKKVEKQKK